MTAHIVKLLPESAQELSLPLAAGGGLINCQLFFAQATTTALARAVVFRSLGAQLFGDSGPGDWPIHAHAYLKDAPQWWVSLSHTRQEAVLLASREPGLAGLGVDIEAVNRALHRNPAQRVAHPEDASVWRQQPLQHWVLKEAAFKAADSARALAQPERASPALSELVIGPERWHWSVEPSYQGGLRVLQLEWGQRKLWCAVASIWPLAKEARLRRPGIYLGDD